MISKNKYLQDNSIRKTFIKLDQTINDALKSLTLSNAKICIVVDKKNNFKGVLNDGDIRRALLKGKNVESKISQVYNKNPIVLKKDFDKKISIKKLKNKDIDQRWYIKGNWDFNRNKLVFQNLIAVVISLAE